MLKENLKIDKKPEEYVNCSVRIRPVINQDNTASSCLQVISNHPPLILVLDRTQTYHFDNIFDEYSDQETVYNETVKPLVEHVKNGYNCTVFAYGQTGTGKTYTMGTSPQVSDVSNKGLIPRAVEDFFVNNDVDIEISLYISFIEIYNERVFDLLENENKIPLMVKGFNAPGTKKIRVFSTNEANYFLEIGNKNRHTAGTKQNSNSSRSHAIFTIYCCVRTSKEEITAKLNLVDLAGSESVKKTGNQGSTFHEGVNINKGLLCIGQVMTALSTNSSFIPYRQSIITTILQDSLNKKNFVTLIACINSNPEDSLETVQTLEFAQRVKKIKNKPEVTEIVSQYKKDNPNLFHTSRTPFKRPLQTPLQTPSVRKLRQLQLHTIDEPRSSTTTESPKSLFSMSVSTINSDLAGHQTFSPVIKKYMQAMENTLVEKLETVIKNTLQKSSRVSLLRREEENKKEDKENTPKFSWNKIQDEVSKLVKTEIALMTENAIRATSSPIEIEANDKIRRVLNYDDCENQEEINISKVSNKNIEFKMPKIPNRKIKSKTRITQTISPIEKLREARRSVRLSLKNSRNYFSLEGSFLVEKPGRNKKEDKIPLDETGFADSENISNESFGDFSVITNQDIRRRSVRIAKKKKTYSPGLIIKSRRRKIVAKTPQTKQSYSKNSPFTTHRKEVLHILNKGTAKEITKLHLIGPKKSEQILLFRKLKGDFKSIEDMSQMPGWSERQFDKFLSENFLKRDV